MVPGHSQQRCILDLTPYGQGSLVEPQEQEGLCDPQVMGLNPVWVEPRNAYSVCMFSVGLDLKNKRSLCV